MQPLTTIDRRIALKALSLSGAGSVACAAEEGASLRLAEGRVGLPLQVVLDLKGPDGAPLIGVEVQVEQAGTFGRLSGLGVSDAQGRLCLETVFPDRTGGGVMGVMVAGQGFRLGFDPAITAAIQEDHEAYAGSVGTLTKPDVLAALRLTEPDGHLQARARIMLRARG